MTQKNLLIFLLLCCSFQGFGQTVPKVLIIGIDGCRVDALQQAATPNIDQLLLNATYSWDALTEAPTWSGVGWSGMLTGVNRSKHGVSDNSFAGSNFSNYPHFFNHIESCNADLETASIVHWGPINSQILDQTDYELIVGTDLAVTTEAVSYLTNNDPDVLFLHYDDVDHEGHAYGFHPSIPQYNDVIELTDTYVGQLMTALNARPNFANEDWIVMVTTDHGGNTAGHGGPSFEERSIFFIVSGNNVPQQNLMRGISNHNFSTALEFNGTDDFVSIPFNNALEFGSNQDFSIECRVRVDAINGDPVIVGNKNWNSGVNDGVVLSFTLPNGPEWKVNIGDGSARQDITGPVLNDGLWHHLVVTFDRDGWMAMYSDGALVERKDISFIGDINSGLPFSIGQDGTTTYGAWFEGAIGEVRIWNTVLDEATIAEYACASIDQAHPNQSDLLANWKIDEGAGNSILDASANAFNGTIQGANPSWNNGSPGILTCYDYSGTPKIYDIAVTALQHLCGSIAPAWDLDGNAIETQPPLAVDLSTWNGQTFNDHNFLQWQKNDLNNFATIELQKSDLELSDFETIHTAYAGGLEVYKDYDLSEKAFYRLKFSEPNGRINFSDLIVLTRSNQGMNSLNAYPSPFENILNVDFVLSNNTQVQLYIFDVLGARKWSGTWNGALGKNSKVIDLANLPKGLFFLVLESNQEKLVQKISK